MFGVEGIARWGMENDEYDIDIDVRCLIMEDIFPHYKLYPSPVAQRSVFTKALRL